MPSATAYRRAPLLDPAYVPLSDSAVHLEGPLESMIQQVLKQVDVNRMSALDSVLATRLGGYAQLPPMPDVEGAVTLLPGEPGRFIALVTGASMLAAISRDKEGMLRVLGAMRAFLGAMPAMTEEALFWCGADALRLASDLYRRTGQAFLLNLLESLRAQLPDVSGLMHMFPFQKEFRPGSAAATEAEISYHQRMERFATGKGIADALSMTAYLSQYSGSGRDGAAPLAGLTALNRFHGMPCGGFSADPYLAGKDPARAVELEALCAQVQACADALWATGEPLFAQRLESLMINALPDLLTEEGVRGLEPTNRLAEDESCAIHKPDKEDVSSLLRALYALARSVWLSKDDDTIAYLLPVEGGCLTRLGGVPVRLTAEVGGVLEKEITLRVECRQSVSFTLQLLPPAWADSATLNVNGGRSQAVAQGQPYSLTRVYQNGDVITLRLGLSPRAEAGYRGSASVFFGGRLMALALPEADVAWQYALVAGNRMTATEEAGEPQVLVTACEAPQWQQRNSFILPPPQGVPMGPAYQLTLIPYAGTHGRIAAFPCVRA